MVGSVTELNPTPRNWQQHGRKRTKVNKTLTWTWALLILHCGSGLSNLFRCCSRSSQLRFLDTPSWSKSVCFSMNEQQSKLVSISHVSPRAKRRISFWFPFWYRWSQRNKVPEVNTVLTFDTVGGFRKWLLFLQRTLREISVERQPGTTSQHCNGAANPTWISPTSYRGLSCQTGIDWIYSAFLCNLFTNITLRPGQDGSFGGDAPEKLPDTYALM